MASFVRIDTNRMELEDVRHQWLADMIGRRRDDDCSICVEVMLDEPDVKLRLTIGNCAKSAGGRRQLTSAEQECVDLWEKHHLDGCEVHHGKIWAFIRQLQSKFDMRPN